MHDQDLEHEYYGHFNETPHTAIGFDTEAWIYAVKQVFDFDVGPPVAWHYEGGICFMWGENLDESLLRNISDACHDFGQQYANDGMYDAAMAASRAALQVIRAEVNEPGEAMITYTTC